MISLNDFKTAVWGMTGRPDVPISPYLASTLAAICRSGNYPEDLITIAANARYSDFEELTGPTYGRVSGGAHAIVSAPMPKGLSSRRLLTSDLAFSDGDTYEPLDYVVLDSIPTHNLAEMLRKCNNKASIYYAAGEAAILLPPHEWARLRSLGSDFQVQLTITALTSNESRGWNWAGGEGATGTVGGEWHGGSAMFPSPVNNSEFIWQLESCIDLVTLGTSAGILRFAGQEREGALMYQEFLISLRRYAADRADSLATL